ncbi:class I SAM-dependent methyltransferase [Sagittula salina]|uniref:Class I SAM-dependent methyltransferase n=1 Tax=Sagittula salina TaxID=2820268 RepID=A0A940MYA8_9RHOB|nr:class I SAM-dependent methyltransferase [Sagittula salina]MBP0485054.1 class I SAM-dependent methyltransferase [Sagittula salina]
MKLVKRLVPRSIRRRSQLYHDLFEKYLKHDDLAFDGDDIRRDVEERYGYSGDLLDIYVAGSAQLIHKWHHYLPIYERYFARWRGKQVRFLEIGVSQGGSLSMWRRYLGDDAIIYGVDIDPACARFDGIDGQVRIGSQDDPDFLRGVVEEMGGVDIILDDGSHVMKHIEVSLETLFPLLVDDGCYMIEDLHTAYWKSFGGGFHRKANFFNYVRDVIDDMHRWYHVTPPRHPQVSLACNSVHVYDSVCVFEKFPQTSPTHSRVQAKP